MRLAINSFKGMVPIIESSKVATENATLATNCRFDSGSLEPYLSSVAESANLVSGTETLFLYEDQYWFSWENEVHAVPSPINNDAYARVYFTGVNAPRMTSNGVATGVGTMPALSYKMGVKQPLQMSIAGIVGNDQNEEGQDDDITRFYVQTYVNGYGEESMPSITSPEVTLLVPGAQVNLTLPSSGMNEQNITRTRIYRTNNDAYQLVADLPISTLSYSDTLSDTELSLVLDTWGYAEPIEDMTGLTLMANGILAGYSDYTLCFSESFLPHAWPVEYQLTTEYEIVGIVAIGGSLVVGTTGNPYLFSGVSPDAISSLKLEISQSCVSSGSMVDMGSFALYASPDGLVAVSPSTATLITERLFNKKQWQQYQPESIKASFYEEKYVAFYGAGRGFIFNPKTLDFIELDFPASALYTDLKRDKLYLSTGSSLSSFDNDAGSLSYIWEKEIRLDRRPGPAAIYIDADSPSTNGFIYDIDGVEYINTADLSTLQDSQGQVLFRLPAQRGRLLTMRLTGTGRINKVAFGSNLSEAKNG